jgi:hypothetical protein
MSLMTVSICGDDELPLQIKSKSDRIGVSTGDEDCAKKPEATLLSMELRAK